MKKSAYPKQHSFHSHFTMYAEWFEKVFQQVFMPEARDAVRAVPSSANILAVHQRREIKL
jgi:hypothetical protein